MLQSIFGKSTDKDAIPVLYCATSSDFDKSENLKGQMFSKAPEVSLYKVPNYFSDDNAVKIYEAIENVIAKKAITSDKSAIIQ